MTHFLYLYSMTRKQYFPAYGLILTTANITSTMCKQSYTRRHEAEGHLAGRAQGGSQEEHSEAGG